MDVWLSLCGVDPPYEAKSLLAGKEVFPNFCGRQIQLTGSQERCGSTAFL
jgi:hypothetical protein